MVLVWTAVVRPVIAGVVVGAVWAVGWYDVALGMSGASVVRYGSLAVLTVLVVEAAVM